MPVVTQLKPQKNGKRVNVYLDGLFSFGIDLDNLVILGIKENTEFTDDEVVQIVKKAEFQKTYDKLLRFATLRPRSTKEVKTWFKRKKIHDSLHEELFNRLKNLELVDDEKFAVWWVEQRQSFRPKSVRALIQELKLKGISSETIKNTLDETKIDEGLLIARLIEKNSHKWANLSPQKRKQKIIQFLSQRGFGWELIEKAIG